MLTVREFPYKVQPFYPLGDREEMPVFDNNILDASKYKDKPIISVIGTVWQQANVFEYSFSIWKKQIFTFPWELIILDDGIDDGVEDFIRSDRYDYNKKNYNLRYIRFRDYSYPTRSCTLLFNTAIRKLVKSPLVLIQWYDRIPGSFDCLERLVNPFFIKRNIVTSMRGRHILSSSSVDDDILYEVIKNTLDSMPWKDDPSCLEKVCGRSSGHTEPKTATESCGLCIRKNDFIALGGYDERYTNVASYANVDLYRRILDAGMEVIWPGCENYHIPHKVNRQKGIDCLSDPTILRNKEKDWGNLPWLYERIS